MHSMAWPSGFRPAAQTQTSGFYSPMLEIRLWKLYFPRKQIQKPCRGTIRQRVYDVCIQLQFLARCSLRVTSAPVRSIAQVGVCVRSLRFQTHHVEPHVQNAQVCLNAGRDRFNWWVWGTKTCKAMLEGRTCSATNAQRWLASQIS